MARLLFSLLLLLACPPTLLAAEDWAQYRVTAAFDDEPGATHAVEASPLPGSPRRWHLSFPVEPGRRTALVLTEEGGALRATELLGVVHALTAEREGWRLLVAPSSRQGQLLVARATLERGPRAPDGGFTPASHRDLTLVLAPRAAPSGPSAADLPAGLALVPGVGAPEDELRAQLGARRPDELTIVYWNVGKGEHRALGPRVPVGGGAGSADPLAANVRAIAAGLRPDFLLLAEVSDLPDGQGGTIDARTQAVLSAVYPGQLLVPSIWEFPRSNNAAIYSRLPLLHVAGEERERRADGSFVNHPWSLPGAPPPGDARATVTSRWLDWTPPGIDLAAELAYRAAWTKRSDWHTRASVRVDLTVGGQPVALFPLHLAMPWLELEPTARRGGFLVDGVQDFQLHGQGPLFFQVERFRSEVARAGHATTLLVGDANISRHPRASFPPLRVDLAATGDGAPARTTSLTFERLADGLEDAFAGDDEAWSWPNPAGSDARTHALARQLIDNVLHGAGLEVRYRAVFFPRGADHGALAVKVRLRRPGAPLVRPRPPRRTPPAALDVDPPRLEVTAPERGALAAVGRLDVVGRVVDPSGAATLTIGGVDVPLGPDGAFRHPVDVAPGLNVIELVAADGAGNVARGCRSVLGGEARPADRPLEEALVVRLERGAFAAAEAQAAARLSALDLDGLLKARGPLHEGTHGEGTSSLTLRVDATSAASGAATVSLVPEAGGLRVRATIADVSAALRLQGTLRLWGWSPRRPLAISARLSARRAQVEAVARVSIADGVVTTRLEGTRVALEGFLVESPLLPKFARPAVSRALDGVMQEVLSRQLERLVPPVVDRLLAGATTPAPRPVGERSLAIRLAPRAVTFDPQGVTLRLAADLSLSAPAGATTPATHPASLGTAGSAPALRGLAVGLAVDDDLLDRAAWAAWRSGALHLRVARGAVPAGLPAWLGELDAGWLAGVLPGAVAGLPGETPLELELAPAAPPVVRSTGEGALTVGLGDLVVRLVARPAGGAPRTVLQAAVQVVVGARVELDEAGRLVLRPAASPSVKVDVFDSPVAALQQTGVEAVLAVALPQALDGLWRRLPSIPLPAPAGLRPADATVGAEGDRLVLRAGALR